MEKQKGQVKEGYFADLVLFSHDLFQVPHEEIRTAKAVMTMIDGRIVFEEGNGAEKQEVESKKWSQSD
jgi:predicted amidohydrolase YtcJ